MHKRACNAGFVAVAFACIVAGILSAGMLLNGCVSVSVDKNSDSQESSGGGTDKDDEAANDEHGKDAKDAENSNEDSAEDSGEVGDATTGDLSFTVSGLQVTLPGAWASACRVIWEEASAGTSVVARVCLSGAEAVDLLWFRQVSEEVPLSGGDPSRGLLANYRLSDGTRIEVWWTNVALIMSDELKNGSWGETGVIDYLNDEQLSAALTLQWGEAGSALTRDVLRQKTESDLTEVPYTHLLETVDISEE